MIFKPYLLVPLVLFLTGCLSTAQKSSPQVIPSDAEPADVAIPNEPLPALSLGEQLAQQANLFLHHKRSITARQHSLLRRALTNFNGSTQPNAAAALETIEEAEALGQLNSTAWVLKHDVLQSLQQQDRAQAALVKALSINPFNPKAASRLAKHKQQQGLFTEAEQLYTRAIEAVPTDALNYRNRGVLYDLYLLQKTQAKRDYQIYYELLSEQLSTQTENSNNSTLTKEHKLVRLWIRDLEKQLAQEVEANND